jgi:hypothetical protein
MKSQRRTPETWRPVLVGRWMVRSEWSRLANEASSEEDLGSEAGIGIQGRYSGPSVSDTFQNDNDRRCDLAIMPLLKSLDGAASAPGSITLGSNEDTLVPSLVSRSAPPVSARDHRRQHSSPPRQFIFEHRTRRHLDAHQCRVRICLGRCPWRSTIALLTLSTTLSCSACPDSAPIELYVCLYLPGHSRHKLRLAH